MEQDRNNREAQSKEDVYVELRQMLRTDEALSSDQTVIQGTTSQDCLNLFYHKTF